MNKGFFIKSFGCSANSSDAENMIGMLQREGYEQTNLDEAEFVVINTCGVKQPTEDRVIQTIKQFSVLDKKLIIAGCLPRINQNRIRKAAPKFHALMDPRSTHKIVDVVRKLEQGHKHIIAFSDRPETKPSLPKSLLNPVTGIVQISDGCNMACSYCCTKFARGRLTCYPKSEIFREVDYLLKVGCKEIWLTSQDNSSYSFGEEKLPNLIDSICDINKEFFIRIGMMHPLHTSRILEDLVKTYKNNKVYKFLHLPIQSASERVLKIMYRGYTPRIALDVIDTFSRSFNRLTLATDIIVGFPTEDNEDFTLTVEFLYKIKPDVVNISKFGLRPDTKAVEFKQLPRELVNKRSKSLVDVVRKISHEKNYKWLGWVGKCLINERGKKEGTWIGRNFAYKPIVVKGDENYLGNFLEVEIVDNRDTYLIGNVIKKL